MPKAVPLKTKLGRAVISGLIACLVVIMLVSVLIVTDVLLSMLGQYSPFIMLLLMFVIGISIIAYMELSKYD